MICVYFSFHWCACIWIFEIHLQNIIIGWRNGSLHLWSLGTNLSRYKHVHVNGKFSCNNCFLKFSSQLSLDQHRRNVHGEVENPSGFCCEICGKSYKQKKHMIRHQQSHTKQDHKCNTCNSTFKTERNLTEHMDNSHSNKSYYCDQCEKSPTRYFQMIRDLENREFSDKTCFQSKKRKRQIALM